MVAGLGGWAGGIVLTTPVALDRRACRRSCAERALWARIGAMRLLIRVVVSPLPSAPLVLSLSLQSSSFVLPFFLLPARSSSPSLFGQHHPSEPQHTHKHRHARRISNTNDISSSRWTEEEGRRSCRSHLPLLPLVVDARPHALPRPSRRPLDGARCGYGGSAALAGRAAPPSSRSRGRRRDVRAEPPPCRRVRGRVGT